MNAAGLALVLVAAVLVAAGGAHKDEIVPTVSDAASAPALALPGHAVERTIQYRSHVDRLKKPVDGQSLCALVDDADHTAGVLRPTLLEHAKAVRGTPSSDAFAAATQALAREVPGIAIVDAAGVVTVARDETALAAMAADGGKELLAASVPLVGTAGTTPAFLDVKSDGTTCFSLEKGALAVDAFSLALPKAPECLQKSMRLAVAKALLSTLTTTTTTRAPALCAKVPADHLVKALAHAGVDDKALVVAIQKAKP